VLLPIAPFTETSGSFVNAEGRVQSFHAGGEAFGRNPVLLGKCLRVLGEHAAVSRQLAFETSARCVETAIQRLDTSCEPSAMRVRSERSPCAGSVNTLCGSIYQLDGLVRRAPSLAIDR
jgi:NADH-quinone oxidoreductase subunit G